MTAMDTVRRICALQPSYSSENTPEMRERGELIRHDLPDHIRRLSAALIAELGEFGDDFIVAASDGIGRKTEAPWVRFASKRMSASPRDGFYVVIHFSADGSGVWVTLGCGATSWDGKEFRPLEDADLQKRTDWARSVIIRQFRTTKPFDDTISLGTRAPLPRAFEKATAIAHRFDPLTCTDAEFEASLVDVAKRLKTVYREQRVGSHLTPGEAAEIELEDLSNPDRRTAVGQGYRLDVEERRAIEQHAMVVARSHLEALGYQVTDRSLTAPFDFEASKAGTAIKVEVKGTTSADAVDIFMTKNEVDLHRLEAGQTALIIVSGIQLNRVGDEVRASKGVCDCQIGWNISDWDAVPIAYKLRRR